MIAGEDRHAIAGLQAARHQGVRQGIGPGVELCIGDPATLVDDRRALTVAQRRHGRNRTDAAVASHRPDERHAAPRWLDSEQSGAAAYPQEMQLVEECRHVHNNTKRYGKVPPCN